MGPGSERCLGWLRRRHLVHEVPELTPEILERVCQACEKAKVPFYKFWTITDNVCPNEADPTKLREEYLEKLVEQAALSVEEQLTYMARSAYSEIDKDERYVLEGAERIEKMTEKFVKKEAKMLAKVERAVERELGFGKKG